MKRHAVWTITTLTALTVTACDKKPDSTETKPVAPAATTATTTAKAANTVPVASVAAVPATSVAAVLASAAAPAGSQQSGSSKYPMTGFTPVDAACKEANVLLAKTKTATRWTWTYIQQTLVAHPEFKVDGRGPMSVAFQLAKFGDEGIGLIASCDGATCNRLAATYKAVVPSSQPQVFCGEVPGKPLLGSYPMETSVPDANAEPIEKCARLGICQLAQGAATGDPALECQKAPGSFKTACATKATCADVVSCAK